MFNIKNDDKFIEAIPPERRLEIDDMLRKTDKEIEALGFEGLMKNSMSFEEFKKHIDEILDGNGR